MGADTKNSDHINCTYIMCKIDCRDDFIQGCEVPVLVLFCSSVTGPHNENVFSRCRTKLIVICNEEQANTIAAKSEQGARAIDVYGKFRSPCHKTLLWT
jgi:hypothetical protein